MKFGRILAVISALLGLADFANAEGVREAFLDDCIAQSKDKYELYRNCIGKFTDVCTADPTRFEDEFIDIAVGPPYRNCTERESIWWATLYDEQAADLVRRTAQRTADRRIHAELELTLKALEGRALAECGYVSVRSGYREGDLVQIQGIDDQFTCMRDINAENAIVVYLWIDR